jgi:hypothetical protein
VECGRLEHVAEKADLSGARLRRTTRSAPGQPQGRGRCRPRQAQELLDHAIDGHADLEDRAFEQAPTERSEAFPHPLRDT